MTTQPHDTDPLYRRVTLDWKNRLPVLGIPVTYECNHEVLAALVNRAFGAWERLPSAYEAADAPPVRVRLIAQNGAHTSNNRSDYTFRMPDPERVFFHTQDSMGVADVSRFEGIAYLGPATLKDGARVQRDVIEMLTLVLVTCVDRTPVHSTMLEKDQVVLILTGPSGVGKSTLAYHSHKRGLRVLSDDASYVQTVPSFRVWGMPGKLHIPPASVRLFPDIAGQQGIRLPNGKQKILVEAGVSRPTLAPTRARVGLCILTRDGEDPWLKKASARDVEAAVMNGLSPARDLYANRMDRVVTELGQLPAWCLNLSHDPAHVDPYIDEMFDSVLANQGAEQPTSTA